MDPLIDQFLRESNAIEGVYDDQSLEDAHKAWEYLMTQDTLSVEMILEMHRILMDRRGAWNDSTASLVGREGIGRFREIPIWIGRREGLEASKVPTAIELWCACQRILPCKTEKDAMDMHIRYEEVHPFADGNGRTGRLLLNWTRVKVLGLPVLIIKESEKHAYYQLFR